MKELSIEQKAKAYDEAIERARKLYNSEETSADVEIVCENIFPELKKSEDEKIRKVIHGWIYTQPASFFDNGISKEEILAWLEKQGEQKPRYGIGDVLCDKSCTTLNKDAQPNFEILDIRNGMYICDKGSFPISQQDEYELVAKKIEQKPADKVEPKFKVGNWYQCTKDFFGKGVTFDKNTAYYCAKEGCLQDEYGCHIAIVKDLYDNFKLWTIQEALDGDVLVDVYGNIGIFEQYDDFDWISYCSLGKNGGFQHFKIEHENENTYPATKEQRDTLMKAIADAGYTFDFEKKELKKIEDEEYNGEDYGIDSLFHAQRILEKTLGEVDGYQSDDGILEHKCAISAVKKLYEQKPAWSEEDEMNLRRLMLYLSCREKITPEVKSKYINWLKSLEERIKNK